MHSDPDLVARVRMLLGTRGLTETAMFGGIVWVLNGNLCAGVWHASLITRIGAEARARLMAEDHVHPMDMTGRPMKAWARIEPHGLAREADLARHVEMAIAFVETLPRK